MSPRSSARAYELGFTAADFCPQAKEILVNVAYKLKEKQPLLDIGHTAARQQSSYASTTVRPVSALRPRRVP